MQAPRKAFILGFLFVAVNVAVADKITTDFDHNTNFSKYRTFKWAEKPAAEDPFMVDRIMQAVNSQVRFRNLQPVPNGADLAINANFTTQEVQTLNTFYSGDGFG